LYQIGETFGTRELIGSYVNNGEQDAQFDFNLYFDARNIFADSTSSFAGLAQSLNHSLSYYGSHHLMGNITGNHDLVRFISYASNAMSFKDNDKKVAWEKSIVVKDAIGYKRLQQLQAFNMCIPGVPVIYYADEYGMPGAGDPDNRRFMQFEGLSPNEQSTLEATRKLVNLRKSNTALTLGDTKVLYVANNQMVILRSYFDEVAIAVFNKGNKSETVEFILPPEFSKLKFISNFKNTVDVLGGKVRLKMEPNSFEILTKNSEKK
jgi:glycosidase